MIKIKITKNLLVSLFIFFSIFSMNSCYAVSVGESFGGGTVFCVSQTANTTKCVTTGSGDYGLIMANEDQANFDSNDNHGAPWSSANISVKGAKSPNNGATNTTAIIAAFPNDNPSNNAAWLCHIYKGGELTDWYLPSINELSKMYEYAKAHNLIGENCTGSKNGGVQCLVGGGELFNGALRAYWSSSEDGSDACNVDFANGSVHNANHKISDFFGVRAIRVFSNSASSSSNH